MSWLDIIIILFVVIGVYKGYKNGFVVELFSLLAILLGIVAGFKLMGIALVFLQDKFDMDERYLPYIAFGVVFIVVVILVSLLGRSIRASIDKTLLGRVDEAAGAGIGIIKSVFIFSVVMWILSPLEDRWLERWETGSLLMPHVRDFAPSVGALLGEYIPGVGDIF